MPIVDIEAGRNVAWLQQFALEPSLSEVERDSLIVAAGVLAARAQRVYALALALREKREDIVNAAVELESYLAKINTQERQSIIFQVPDDDMDGVALAGFCERLTQLSKAIRALKSAAPSAGEGEKT
jgi:hypothetical protein